MMKENKNLTKEDWIDLLLLILIIGGISVYVTLFWQGLEVLIYKEIQHRLVDDIIALILIVSLSINLKYLMESCIKKGGLK